MKNIISKLAIACGAAAILVSCSLDEYNPAAGTGGDKATSFEGWSGMQTYCYQPLYGQLVSAFDFEAVAEGGTDLWQTANNKTWASEVFHYEGLASNTNYTNKLFKQAYAMINTCNAVINNSSKVEGNEHTIKVLTAEARVLRAYYYYLLVTNYGNVTLKLDDSANEVLLTPTRNTYEELYTQIVTDLREAANDLDVTPYNGERGRVTKKTALGLLARAYAQGAGEGLSENGVSYWQRAKEVAEDMISNAAAYGCEMYSDISDVWAPDNNRNNKEALFIATGLDVNEPLPASYSYSNVFTYFWCDPNKCSDLYTTGSSANYFYGRVNNNILAPSKYLIDLYDDDADMRWENTFTTAFGDFTMVAAEWGNYPTTGKAVITPALRDKYKIGGTGVTRIYPYADMDATPSNSGWNQYSWKVWPKGEHSGDISKLQDVKNALVNPYPMDPEDDRFPLYLSKKTLTDEEKAAYKYCVVNIDDLFETSTYGAPIYYASALPNYPDANVHNLWPCLNKINWAFAGVYTNNLQRKVGDVFIMRFPEIYLIAAEANVALGNGAKAAEYLNTVAKRSSRDGKLASYMKLTTATEDDVLNEYARELCGEFTRWAVLKRHGYSKFKSQLQMANPRAAASFSEKHMLRPISYDFLNQIDNAEEYGNNGY